ncbi:MAG: hypothetical protein J0L76_10315 [Rhodobacterales bacterium]|nr:hypothetical protein [Rhodobacterales bacterium]
MACATERFGHSCREGQPPLTARFAQGGEVFGPVLRMRVARGGAEKIEVDAVHGFRPNLGCPFVLPEFVRYSESGISAGRKLSLYVTLA